MLVILAVLLMTVFFLPDFIGPIPALLIGAAVIGAAFFVYNKWCGLAGEDEDTED